MHGLAKDTQQFCLSDPGTDSAHVQTYSLACRSTEDTDGYTNVCIEPVQTPSGDEICDVRT